MRKYLTIIGKAIGIITGIIITLWGVFWILVTIEDVYSDERDIGAMLGIVSIVIGVTMVASIINLKNKK